MAQKESRIDKFKRLVSQQSHIRNVCTSAHIHHGKCISGESRLLMLNGEMKNAKEIFNSVAETGRIVRDNEDHIVYEPSDKLEIFSLNKETGKIETRQISHAWRLIGGKTIKIKARNGFEIETTPEHKYTVSRNDEFVDVEAKDIKLGDRIVCARKIKVENKQNIEEEIIKGLAKDNFYVNLDLEFHEALKTKIFLYGSNKIKKELGISIKVRSFYHGIWQNRYNLTDLIKICSLFGINLENLYDRIEFIFYRTGKQRGHNSLKMKMPKNFEEFFYLAGLFLGDGSERKFIVGKEDLGKRFIEICHNLGISPIKKQWKEKTPEIHTNLTLVHFLKCLFDYPERKKSHNIKISEFVLKSEDKYVAQLLKAYFDCDGCVEKSRRAVTISSASGKMIKDLHLLLLRFGCIAIKEKDNSLSISGISALNFLKNIGFYMNEKEEKLKKLAKQISGSIVCDTIKVGNQVMLINKLIKSKVSDDLAFIEVKLIEEGYQNVVYDFTIPENHNFIAEGMVIHNTAMTDNLLAAAGMMASKNAGDLDAGMMTWQHADEQERLLTVDSANVSMVHEYEGKEYLINLIDTPGHVDFSGNVTSAMRAVDGTIVLVCASEGIMPQTETVIKQALRERVKPLLFINKFDRLLKELKLSPEAMQERIIKIIANFNKLIERIAEPEYKEKWKVSITDGSVAFGSARDNWALSLPFMKKKNVSFRDITKIYELPEQERKDWIWKNAPLYEVILDMVIKHHPSPVEAQKYRIPKIWRGDLDSELGKDLISCNPKGKLAFIITKIIIDPRTGKEVSVGRLFSGTLREGLDVYLNQAKLRQKLQQVFIYDGIKTEPLPEIPAGNVCALGGIIANTSETITSEPEEAFQEIKHIFEPVVTQAIEAKKAQDLPKLISVLKQVTKEDPCIRVQINEETGQHLLSGMGELHLEIIANRIRTEKNVEIKTTPPIVVYRESITKASGEFEGKSPNKHNTFFMTVEPLEDAVYEAIKAKEIPNMKVKKKDEALINKLRSLGVDNDEIKQYREIYDGCVLLDKTRGEVHIGEVIELVMEAFEQIVDYGVLAREPCVKLKVCLVDTKLHEDAIHRGPAQVLPAVRDAIRLCILDAKPILFEPLQKIQIECTDKFINDVTRIIQSRRGQMLGVEQEEDRLMVHALLPVAEMFGLSNDMRSATEGRASFFLVDQMFAKVPSDLQEKIIRQIRQRKGLSEGQ